jgi:hypothetical protein
MNGISFSTTLGGKFDSTGGFSIATHLGFKMATFAGVDVSTNVSVGIKMNLGGYYEFGSLPKYEMHNGKLVCNKEKTELATKFNNISTQINTVAGDLDYWTNRFNQRCSAYFNDSIAIKSRCVDLESKFYNMKSTGVACTFECANFNVSAGNISITGLVVKLG